MRCQWRGDLVRNAQAAGYFADPVLYQDLLNAERLSRDIGAYDNEKEVYDCALKRCDPEPIVRAKTPKAIGLHLEEFDWTLDKVGRRVLYENGDEIVDLQNECDLIEIYTNYRELVLVFKRLRGDFDWSYLGIGDSLALVIAGAEMEKVPPAKLPATFQGLHDLTRTSCSLTINHRVYPVHGKDLIIQFIPAQ